MIPLLLLLLCSHTTAAAGLSCCCCGGCLCLNVTPGFGSTPCGCLTRSVFGTATNAGKLLLLVVCMDTCQRHISVMLVRLDHLRIAHHMQLCDSVIARSSTLCTLCSFTHGCRICCCCCCHPIRASNGPQLSQAAAVTPTAAVTMCSLHRAAVGTSTEPQAVAGKGPFPRASPAAGLAKLE